MNEFEYREIEAATGGFALERLIGKGSHGCVYRGVLGCGKRVAVKVPSLGREETSSKLDSEIDVLASVHGPHLVNLLGVCPRSPTRGGGGGGGSLLVMEYMPNGSLHSLLHECPPSGLAPSWSWARRALVALQVARAVRALHEAAPPIVHRDIKSANILFDASWNARLADFSLAVRPGHGAWDPPAGTIGYLDPCYTAPGKLGPANDVFSFGVVLLELVGGRPAMDAARGTTSIVAWAVPLIGGAREAEVFDPRVAPPRGGAMERAAGRMLGVAARCVSPDEERRPSMGEVVAELQQVLDELVRSPPARWWNMVIGGGLFARRSHPCMGGGAKAGGRNRNHLIHDEPEEASGGSSG